MMWQEADSRGVTTTLAAIDDRGNRREGLIGLPGARVFRLLLFSLGLIVAAAACPASALASPTYDGAMSFPTITGPSSPEVYSWTVNVHEEEVLKSIGDHLAGVFWPEGTLAMVIKDPRAHDADGKEVPTTLSVLAPDVVTLTVHHLAGNPAAGGAPFIYPVTVGRGWEGGFHTEIVHLEGGRGPEPPVLTSPEGCLVPSLRGKAVKAVRMRLKRAHCTLGTVRHRRDGAGGSDLVIRQSRSAGTELARWTSIDVTLGH